MTVRLHELMRELPGRLPPEDPEVTGVAHDSRRVGPGDLFVAIAGEHADGRRFAGQAAAGGAVAVMGAEPAPPGLRVPWVAVEDPRALLGPLAVRVYGRPHARLLLVAVTGTNGKSTVTRLIARVLEAAGRPAGFGGTLGYRFAGRDYASPGGGGRPRTTLEACDLVRALAEMARDGAAAACLEASSHGLALGRVDALEFDLAVFTNLTRDHLDFHGDLESYFAVKRRLFTDYLKPAGRAVIGVGDDWGRRLAGELAAAGVPVVTWGEDDGDVRAASAELDLAGIRARLVTPRGELAVASPLIGRFNLLNVLAAVAVAEALELEPAAAVRGIAAEGPLPGRLEPVRAGQDFPVFVDYAHTPGALAAALGSLRELSARRIAVVFGCGGERDRGKRPEMGRIAGELADLAIVTSDNPRGEDPEAILDAVEVGLRQSGGRYRRVTDRRAALREAVEVAASGGAPGWMVLAAGKGHEQVQLVGESRIPFSDRRELEAALARSGNA
ncbi:MAG TPA: UDP-N-acetylmuramoyl-L-alanyl-D-glutamate--2,6-diaminopimelate ligase [Thermoanaerobaculia bacterium]